MDTGQNYLEIVKKQFKQYKLLGEKAINQLEPDKLFFSSNADSNSIAIIIKHMYGNMLSRWTDFLSTDGEKPWRKRDDEFEYTGTDKAALIKNWEEGWACLFTAINSLKAAQLSEIVFIRGEAHTVIEAINRQLAHYSYHVGQIVFAAKQLKKGEWGSLSIPKRKT
ncbi:MAG: DUF1572 family protein [Ferruginibacter sp.]